VVLVSGELGEEPQLARGEHQDAALGAHEMLRGQDLEGAHDELSTAGVEGVLHATMLTIGWRPGVNGS
jgi:hypothetical protein